MRTGSRRDEGRDDGSLAYNCDQTAMRLAVADEARIRRPVVGRLTASTTSSRATEEVEDCQVWALYVPSERGRRVRSEGWRSGTLRPKAAAPSERRLS